MVTIRTAEQAAEVARNTKTNTEGMCQQVTRGYYLAPSAGDRDGDGDADAYDGWLSEPLSARHPGDRNPPLGYPVSFKGGRTGHGHRAISFGRGLIRSTDFDTATKRYKAGVVGTGTIAEVERAMGVTYLGWSKTITGLVILSEPVVEKPLPPKENPVLTRVRNAWKARGEVDIHDLNELIKAGDQPAAQAAKDWRNAIQTGAKQFFEEVD